MEKILYMIFLLLMIAGGGTGLLSRKAPLQVRALGICCNGNRLSNAVNNLIPTLVFVKIRHMACLQRHHRYNNCTGVTLFNRTVNPGLCYTPPGINLKNLPAG